jgi:hypothetical protein
LPRSLSLVARGRRAVAAVTETQIQKPGRRFTI